MKTFKQIVASVTSIVPIVVMGIIATAYVVGVTFTPAISAISAAVVVGSVVVAVVAAQQAQYD